MSGPELWLYASDDSTAARKVWPPAEPLPPHFVQEEQNYTIELRNAATSSETAELFIDDHQLEPLRSRHGVARWRWNPGFNAGRVEFSLMLGKGLATTEFELVTDPLRAKLTRTQFDLMVGEILEDSLTLFSLSAFRVGVAAGTGAVVPPLARLEYIRSRISQLEQAIGQIAARPVRTLAGHEGLRPLSLAAPIRSYELRRSLTGTPLRKVTHQRLPAIPQHIRKQTRVATADIAEHRAIGAFLRALQSWLDTAASRLEERSKNEDDLPVRTWIRRSRSLARRVGRLIALPLFDEITITTAKVRVSPIFRHVLAYRRFFKIHREISLGLARVQGDFLNMPVSRTFELYELWVFLRLVRAAVQHFNVTTVSVEKLFDAGAAATGVAQFAATPTFTLNGVTFALKRPFREYWLDNFLIGSFTRDMIPDISVVAPSGDAHRKLVVLDAKYRVLSHLNDAISSLHTYRDAIVRETEHGDLTHAVVAAYLVSPHVAALSAGTWKSTKMPHRLFHPEYRSKFRFGAVSLIPGMTLAQVHDVLKLVIEDASAKA
jgi:hypothetical protein